MSAGATGAIAGGVRVADVLAVVARWFLGGMFLYMGLSKALHPVEFLKLVRQYDLLHHHALLNFVASALPWFEIFCGLLLLLGVAVRGASVMLVAMLIPFSLAVLMRALDIHEAGHLAFCAIKFDCGCGAGEVLICRKLAENVLLTGLSAALIFWRRHRFCLRTVLVGRLEGEGPSPSK
jgi:uncharacterized membrane protein YphA (DoxX/SURF4 family)